jgi:peroxiredoxin
MSTSSRPASPAPGQAAPAVTFVDPTGGPIDLDDVLTLGNGRPTLLVFFKSSCPVCKLAWPYLQKLHDVRSDAVRIVGVSQDDAPAARRFYADQGGATFGLLLDPEPKFTASNAFGVESVPHHVLIEPDGTIARLFSGWQRREMDELARLLADRNHFPFIPAIAEGDPVPSFKPG